MADYLHGAYGTIEVGGVTGAEIGANAMVYVGTAPAHQVGAGAAPANKPVLVRSFNEAKALFGYSPDWEHFTLCEAMYAHFMMRSIGPVIFINVFNPAASELGQQQTVTATPVNGMVKVKLTAECAIDSVAVTGKDASAYTKEFDGMTDTLILRETSSGALGTTSLTITYKNADLTDIDGDLIIGSDANASTGTNGTGLYALKSVYQQTRFVPAYLVVPGFSSDKAVHDVMCEVSQKVNSHWDMYLFTDLPVVDVENDDAPIMPAGAAAWKAANGYDKPFETVCYPMIEISGGRKMHMSVMRAMNMQQLLNEESGIPYRSASNTDAPEIVKLSYAEGVDFQMDETMVNEYLNKHGIASAAYVAGRWAMWGAHAANYEFGESDRGTFETDMMMLYYVSNDFQMRRAGDVDKPMSMNDIRSIMSEEQARLSSLISIGALIYGVVEQDNELMAFSDVINGDFKFSFKVTTTPLAKSLTALVGWTDEGFVSYYADFVGNNA